MVKITIQTNTVFLHSCRFRSCPGGDSNERGRPASTVQSTAIVAPDHSARKMWATFWSYDRHRGWTALEKDCSVNRGAAGEQLAVNGVYCASHKNWTSVQQLPLQNHSFIGSGGCS